ncbi:ABC transporter permease [Bacillus sp. CLL-7-23]|uniref:ABC transporter permease n=1 Tax=Bacillus changyiensis TaxID=3004103 RepID=A0ABT4WYZ2_9BACI|nr:ABC transporter permease [Bacillus changyiensis]MDA7025150.1 ABC transporter permease [Bacillus changyiensis]
MTFRQFAFNNVLRNKRLYVAYFLSSMFMVMVFFTFALFAFHPVISGDVFHSGLGKKSLFGLKVAGGIIYVFSFFFVLYSMSAFLKSRKKEFGILMVQGMSMRQIRLMVFLENMLIGCFATIGGITLGLVFAKLILLIAEKVLMFNEKLNFYFPLLAIIVTFVSFIVLFLFISFFVAFILRSEKLLNLLKGDKQSKGEPKASILLTILAALLLGVGYFFALITKGNGVFFAVLPVTIVVTIGTYLFFTQLSVYVIRKLKGQETLFWRKTNMILFSDLSYRMKDNARTFFMVAIISTVAFCAIGTLYGLQSFFNSSTRNWHPNTFTYNTKGEDKTEAKDVDLINKTLKQYDIQAKTAHMTLKYFHVKGQEQLIVQQSDFNRFAALIGEKTIQLSKGKAVAVGYKGFPYSKEQKLLHQPIDLQSGKQIQADQVIKSKALAEEQYYLVTDTDYKQLKEQKSNEHFYAWQVQKEKEKTLIHVGEELLKKIPSTKFSGVDQQVFQGNKDYGPVFFVGLFIGIVFFVSAGSFLYFRLYADVDDDKQKFTAISKMGLTEKELKKVLNRQIAMLFFAPIIVALIHGAVALTALSHAFEYNLFKESATVLSVFALIQLIYFFIVRFYYIKQIKAVI